jgi:hypothetical protein
MASFGDVLASLREFRNELAQQADEEVAAQFTADDGGVSAFAARGPGAGFAARGAGAAFATPLSNVHATGVGVRVRGGKVVPDEFVIKVFVYEKLELGEATPALTKSYGGLPVDVEHLPVQLALAGEAASEAPAEATAQAAVPPQRRRVRPIVGGVSIAPINQFFVGTLGLFLRRNSGGTIQTFALSNNHVMADVNRLPIGTLIVQPGPEVAPTRPGDVFAALSAFIPIQFPTTALPAANRFDAAISVVTDPHLIGTGKIFGVANYTPQLGTPVPGMRVTKSGRTTGVTTGVITATHVNGVQVNYGIPGAPRIAKFNDTVQIVGDHGPFSAPGDSGSAIIETATGKPVALLFAGDGRTTTACDLGGVCRQFQAFPV